MLMDETEMEDSKLEGVGMEGLNAVRSASLEPTPYTLHPTPYTLHPTPYTLHPQPNVVLQKSIFAQIRQLIIHISSNKGLEGLNAVRSASECSV